MLLYVLKRLAAMVPTMIVISIVSFVIIQLPPGDFLTTLVAKMSEQGESVDSATLEALRLRYGLDEPWYVQYWKWISGIVLRGDFGQSFEWNRPVADLMWERMGMTAVVSLATLVFVWGVALPIGIYVAVRPYSLGDNAFTGLAFLGLAMPNFLFALLIMYVGSRVFGMSVGGLFSEDYQDATWSLGKLADFLGHLWVPVLVLGLDGIARMIRIMRANLLDELNKPYVEMARAKGLSEGRLLLKYPVRVALNPFVSTLGWELPTLVSGTVVVAIVLSLPLSGPLLLSALFAQDMYLAGSFILVMSLLTLVGTLISDLLLAWLDPRVRYQ
jgi:peptide/nickel transport system permease protein